MPLKALYPIIISIALTLSATVGYGQLPYFEFKHYSVSDGLSQTSITAINQDEKGFVWLGTYDGLNKFDGHQFEVYKHAPEDSQSLSHNFINVLYFDCTETLWVGTKYGLNKYDKYRGCFIPYLPEKNDSVSLSDAFVTAITEDTQGNLWVGTNNGLNRMNKETGEFKRFFASPDAQIGLRDNRISALFTDSQGRLWVGTFGGGLHWYNGKNRFVPVDPLFNKQAKPIGMFVKAIEEDRKGNIWFATHHSGLFVLDFKSGELKRFEREQNNPNSLATNHTTSILHTQNHEMWVGTEKGISIFKLKDNHFSHIKHKGQQANSLLDNQVHAIFQDRSDAIWIGTAKGVNYYHKHKDKFAHFYHKKEDSTSLSENLVFSMYDDPHSGGIWVGTLNGLNFFDTEDLRFTHYRNEAENKSSLAHNHVWSVLRDFQGQLWVGTNGGLDRFNLQDSTFEHVLVRDTVNQFNRNVRVRHVFEDSQQELWVATAGSGLYRFDKKRKKIRQYIHNDQQAGSLPGNYVKLTYEDHLGQLWVGTSNGLGKFDRKTGTFKVFRHNRYDNFSLSNNVVFAITEDPRRQLWVGTAGGGLNYFDQANQSFLHFREKDGLPNDVVYSIIPDNDGRLWISTNKGVSCFDPALGNFQNYDVSDGLQSNEFVNGSYTVNQKGEIFLGGVNGFNVFHPDSLKNHDIPSPAVLTKFSLFNKEVKVEPEGILTKHISETQEIHLSHEQTFFSLEFVAVNFEEARNTQYAYKLNGFDSDWNYVGNRKVASYTGVPPGEYTFIVKAGTKSGSWNEDGQKVEIIIHPPFWQTWWFRLSVVLLVTTCVYSWYAFRIRRIKSQKKVLQKLVQERTAEVMLQKEEIRMQYEMLENIYQELQEKNKSLNSSIAYARQIQEASLPPLELLRELLPESFVLFGPREKVSGDFFWFTRQHGKIVIACADCTGHGVPGAFMSMTGSTMLNHIVVGLGIMEAGKILKEMHRQIRRNLRQEETHNHDGMDIALCVIDSQEGIVEFAGAKNPLVYIQNGVMHQIKGNRNSIGGAVINGTREFNTHRIALKNDTEFYLFTDGYADQFGGKEGRKFMARRLRDYFYKMHQWPMEDQKKTLSKVFSDWLGNDYQQIDDVLVMGFRLQAREEESLINKKDSLSGKA